MLLITLVLITFLFVSSVSAEEIICDISDELSSVDDSIVLKEDQSVNSSEVLNSPDDGSFTALQNKVSSGSIVELENDYEYKDSDSSLKDGIKITQSVTINGNGYTIDAKGMARVFNITGNNVVLNNVIIKNAQINDTIDFTNSVYYNLADMALPVLDLLLTAYYKHYLKKVSQDILIFEAFSD